MAFLTILYIVFIFVAVDATSTCEEACLAKCKADNVCLNACTGSKGAIQVDFVLASKKDVLGNPVVIRFGRFPGDDVAAPQRMFVANQDGRLMYSDHDEEWKTMVDFAVKISTTVNPSASYTEAGLLGFTLHPQFSANGRFFVWYSIPRANGNVANRPNCSFGGGFGASGPSNNRRNFGADRPYQPDVYTDLVVLEEYKRASINSATVFVRRLITIKHFFTNHYGINNLVFEENGKLLVAVGDGGCYYDQYGVAQNRSFIAGKVISVDVDAGIPPVSCTTPVLLWSELSLECAATSKIFTLYASGVRNMGHMSVDVYEGKINRHIAMIGQNRAEAIYSFQWESNFGWYRRENRLCACLHDDLTADAQCDFRQTLAECLNETSITGRYDTPFSTFNQANDHVSSIAGGFVYRGTELPCALRGAYILGDWSTKDPLVPGFPAPFNGALQLFSIAGEGQPHGKLRVGNGLLYEKNYLASWGYDIETDRIYMGVQDIITPYKDGSVSRRGQIYVLTSPIMGVTTTITTSSRSDTLTVITFVLVLLLSLLALLSLLSSCFVTNTKTTARTSRV